MLWLEIISTSRGLWFYRTLILAIIYHRKVTGDILMGRCVFYVLCGCQQTPQHSSIQALQSILHVILQCRAMSIRPVQQKPEIINQKPEIINQNPETSCRTQCPVAQPVVAISGPAQPTLPNNVRKNISMAYLAVSTALHALTLTASSIHAGQTNITHAGQTSRA